MNHKIILQSPRLVFREFVSDDLEALYKLYGNPQVMRYISGEPRSFEKTKTSLSRHITDYATHGMGLWAVYLKDDPAVMIGRCGIEARVEQNSIVGELAWLFGPSYWGKKLGTESGRHMLVYGFEQLGLQRIIAKAHPNNIASIKIMKRLGMEFKEDTGQRVLYEKTVDG